MLSRSSKLFFAASAAALFGWVFGTILIGKASIRHLTSSGPVDMTNPEAALRAIQDPTFTASMSWGTLTLTGTAWPIVLPVLCAIVGVALVYGAAALGNRKNK